jgi:hypothetical protein
MIKEIAGRDAAGSSAENDQYKCVKMEFGVFG